MKRLLGIVFKVFIKKDSANNRGKIARGALPVVFSGLMKNSRHVLKNNMLGCFFMADFLNCRIQTVNDDITRLSRVIALFNTRGIRNASLLRED